MLVAESVCRGWDDATHRHVQTGDGSKYLPGSGSESCSNRGASIEVGGAVVSVAIVLTAVFVPTALISGISGQFYRQFALTIAIATLISAFNSLTLSPALAALLIKPGHAKKDVFSRLIETSLGWFFRLFNRTFDWGISVYGGIIKRLLRVSILVLVTFAGLLAANSDDFLCLHFGCITVSYRCGRGCGNGSSAGNSGVCRNDRGDLFRDFAHPGLFLCDHEVFRPETDKGREKRGRATREARGRANRRFSQYQRPGRDFQRVNSISR